MIDWLNKIVFGEIKLKSGILYYAYYQTFLNQNLQDISIYWLIDWLTGEEEPELKSGGHSHSHSHEHKPPRKYRPKKVFKKPPIVIVKKIVSASTTTPIVNGG